MHYPKAVHQHEAYRDNPRVGNLSVSERLSGRVVSLPLYPELRRDEVERVIAAVCGAIAMN